MTGVGGLVSLVEVRKERSDQQRERGNWVGESVYHIREGQEEKKKRKENEEKEEKEKKKYIYSPNYVFILFTSNVQLIQLFYPFLPFDPILACIYKKYPYYSFSFFYLTDKIINQIIRII